MPVSPYNPDTMTQDNRTAEFHAWIRERVELAKRLDEGECGGSYGDAMLVCQPSSVA